MSDAVVLKIAVVGETCAGKSALINKLRGGLTGDDKEWAPEGEDETTKETQMYKARSNGNVELYDVPGMDSFGKNLAKYFSENNLDHFDFFILVMRGPFKESDKKIAEHVLMSNKWFSVVRTHMKSSIESSTYSRKTTKEQTMTEIRNDIEDKLEILVPGSTKRKTVKVFLVDNHCHEWEDQFDLPYLEKFINKETLAEEKRAFILKLENKEMSQIEAAYARLKEKHGVLSGVGTAFSDKVLADIEKEFRLGISSEIYWKQKYFFLADFVEKAFHELLLSPQLTYHQSLLANIARKFMDAQLPHVLVGQHSYGRSGTLASVVPVVVVAGVATVTGFAMAATGAIASYLIKEANDAKNDMIEAYYKAAKEFVSNLRKHYMELNEIPY